MTLISAAYSKMMSIYMNLNLFDAGLASKEDGYHLVAIFYMRRMRSLCCYSGKRYVALRKEEIRRTKGNRRRWLELDMTIDIHLEEG